MNRESTEAIGLVLATLNLDDVYPAQRGLLREALEAAKRSQEQIATLTAMCETLNKLQETAVAMLKPAIDAAYQKGYADAMGWKTQNHLEHLPPTEQT